MEIPEEILEAMQERLNFCQNCEPDDYDADDDEESGWRMGEESTVGELLESELENNEDTYPDLIAEFRANGAEDFEFPDFICNNCAEPFSSWFDAYWEE
ncbi:MAG: hypothetical protein HYV63_23275 [Candidatus Schekmanbacteria bacterium]|nr:hypothetical protein [Candidatus Schekmanbacteria bacterium]